MGREAAHFRCEPDQTWQKSLVLPMLGTFTRSSSPPPDSKMQYPDLVMHELEQMRSDLNNEREYRAAMQLESSRMQESKFSLSLSLSLLSLLAKLLAPRTGMRIARPVWFAGRREREGERERERERELKRSFWPRAPDRSTQCEFFTSASVLVWSKRLSTGQLRNGFLGGCQPEVGGGGSYSGVGARDDVLVYTRRLSEALPQGSRSNSSSIISSSSSKSSSCRISSSSSAPVCCRGSDQSCNLTAWGARVA